MEDHPAVTEAHPRVIQAHPEVVEAPLEFIDASKREKSYPGVKDGQS
jgi:hypothetical protein